jgi:hypothetical protein|tara:strand:- start:529 stop:894 length:366 start_codon:yes stop_codon:yes gene_type:complete
MKKKMFFMETYKSPKSGKTMLVFSDNQVSQEEVEGVRAHNETVSAGSIVTKFAGIDVNTYGSFKQTNSGDQLIVPLNGVYNFSPEKLTKMRESTHNVIQGEPVTYSSGNKSTFRYLGKLDM